MKKKSMEKREFGTPVTEGKKGKEGAGILRAGPTVSLSPPPFRLRHLLFPACIIGECEKNRKIPPRNVERKRYLDAFSRAKPWGGREGT